MSAGDLNDRISLFQSLNLLSLMVKQLKIISRRISPAAYESVEIDLLTLYINQLSAFTARLELNQSHADGYFHRRAVLVGLGWFDSDKAV